MEHDLKIFYDHEFMLSMWYKSSSWSYTMQAISGNNIVFIKILKSSFRLKPILVL